MSRNSRRATTPALDRLRRDAPDGPPFLCLLLDVPTVECLTLGTVNARAEVAARRALEALRQPPATKGTR